MCQSLRAAYTIDAKTSTNTGSPTMSTPHRHAVFTPSLIGAMRLTSIADGLIAIIESILLSQ